MKEGFGGKGGELIVIVSGEDGMKSGKEVWELGVEMGKQVGLGEKKKFGWVWVVELGMLEWREEEGGLMGMEDGLSEGKEEDIGLVDRDGGGVGGDG